MGGLILAMGGLISAMSGLISAMGGLISVMGGLISAMSIVLFRPWVVFFGHVWSYFGHEWSYSRLPLCLHCIVQPLFKTNREALTTCELRTFNGRWPSIRKWTRTIRPTMNETFFFYTVALFKRSIKHVYLVSYMPPY